MFKLISQEGLSTYYPPESIVVNQAAPNTGVWVVCEGMTVLSCQYPGQRESVLQIVPPTGLMGIVEFSLESRRYHFTSRTLTNATIAFFPVKKVQKHLENHPTEIMNALKQVCRGMYHLQKRFVLRNTANAPDRLISTILWLSGIEGFGLMQGERVPFKLSNAFLSTLIGARPETVGRIMNQLQEENLIGFSHESMYIKDYEKLQSNLSIVQKESLPSFVPL